MSAAEKLEAARHRADPIEHGAGFIGALAGAVVGLAIGIALVAGTVVTGGGLAVFLGTLLVAAGTAASISSLGKDIGKFIGEKLSYNAGNIKRGSPDVTVGGRHLQAARVEDPVDCHDGKRIAEGVKFIAINNKLAARVELKTECNGTIKEGCATVKYHGPVERVLEVKDPDDPAWFFWATEALDWLSWVGGVTGFFKEGGKRILRLLINPRTWRQVSFRQAYDALDKVYFLADKYFGGNFADYLERTGHQRPQALDKWGFTDSDAYKLFKIGWGSVGARYTYRDWRSRRSGGGSSDAPAGGGNQSPPADAPGGGGNRPPSADAPAGGNRPPSADAPAGGNRPPSADAPTAPRRDSDLLEIPQTPPGYRRTESGLLVPEAPRGFQRTESGLLIPSPAPRIEPPGGGRLWLPGQAPRVEPPILTPSALPAPAPRVSSLILSP